MTRFEIELADGTMSALRFGPDGPPELIFCHANGFNAQVYRAVIEPLGVRSVALDLRGHGMTRLPTNSAHLPNWHVFADDIAAVFDQIVTEPVVLAGHSYGAVSALLSLPKTADRISGYVGFDPVLVPKLFQWITGSQMGRNYMRLRLPIARKAGQRRDIHDSLDSALERYRGRGAFKGILDDVLLDYIEGGTVPAEDGRIRLACDPKWEQAIYIAQSHDAFREVPKLPSNSRLIFAGGRGQVSTRFQRWRLRKKNPSISVEFEADRGHLFPLRDPAFASGILADVMTKAREGTR